MRMRRGKGLLVAILLLLSVVLAGRSSFAEGICVRALGSNGSVCTPGIIHP